MAKNPDNKEGPFLADSKGTLKTVGGASGRMTVTNERHPVKDDERNPPDWPKPEGGKIRHV